MGKTVVIMMGLQGSGKSTFCERHFKDGYVRVNLDTLKTRKKEQALIEDCIKNGKSFVVDNTNPTKADRKRYIEIAKLEGYRVVGYFMESKLKSCIEKNNRREGKQRLPSAAIAATSNKLELPELSEGFDELYFVKNAADEMTIEDWRD